MSRQTLAPLRVRVPRGGEEPGDNILAEPRGSDLVAAECSQVVPKFINQEMHFLCRKNSLPETVAAPRSFAWPHVIGRLHVVTSIRKAPGQQELDSLKPGRCGSVKLSIHRVLPC